MRHLRALPWLVAAACFVSACGSTSGAGPAAPPGTSAAAGPSSGSGSASEERNKALVLRIFAEGFNQNRTDVVQELAGIDGPAKRFADVKAKIPGAVATVKHVAADGDLVAVHWHASATPANEATGEAKVDLYRVDNGRLVEHWGITQTVPAKTANGNSLFNDVHKYPNGAPARSEEEEETNRKFAVEAYRSLSDGDATVIDKSWDPRYYQHNPAVANGTGPLKQFMQQATPASAPATPTQFGHTLADADLVWVLSSDYVVADLFRVVGGKIIEHWDVAADGQ